MTWGADRADTADRTLRVNGHDRTVAVADETEQLLYLLRNALGQRGPKFGCGVAQCGACTVLVDGEIRRSCVTPRRTVPERASVETLDGLGTPGAPHPLQQAFIDQQAGQCAYCVNGMITGALGWLRQRKAAGDTSLPSEQEIAEFLSGEAAGSSARRARLAGVRGGARQAARGRESGGGFAGLAGPHARRCQHPQRKGGAGYRRTNRTDHAFVRRRPRISVRG
ncbi:2Fe-2S iron-sulfur cluster-binding protein [Actinopolymorpha alba]|uniref:(2Fe-2S)-binding protein n=1 Tax=Actinopolymorpha alba TaxID=533267 RepID=UPI000A073458